MGLRIVDGSDPFGKKAFLYDSTSGWALGPAFDDADEAEDFLEWLASQTSKEARELSQVQLREYHDNWLSREEMAS